MCTFLIGEKVDVNAIDYFGRSPLFEAILTGNKRIVCLLVKRKAQVHASTEDLTDLLLHSAVKGDLDMLKLLFHAGLKSFNEYTNVDERNIAHVAAAEGKLEIIKFLKYSVKFDFSKRDVWDRTPLDDAI